MIDLVDVVALAAAVFSGCGASEPCADMETEVAASDAAPIGISAIEAANTIGDTNGQVHWQGDFWREGLDSTTTLELAVLEPTLAVFVDRTSTGGHDVACVDRLEVYTELQISTTDGEISAVVPGILTLLGGSGSVDFSLRAELPPDAFSEAFQQHVATLDAGGFSISGSSVDGVEWHGSIAPEDSDLGPAASWSLGL